MSDRDVYTASEAARALGISLDTLRRWDRSGRIKTRRDDANRRLVPAREIARLKGGETADVSARNRAGGEAAASDIAGSGKLQVVTTTGQIGDMARHVGGELVEVTALMGPGVDPHLYVASEGDVDRLVQADVILYNGLFLEAQMADVLRQVNRFDGLANYPACHAYVARATARPAFVKAYDDQMAHFAAADAA